jgi:hypothetical protein
MNHGAVLTVGLLLGIGEIHAATTAPRAWPDYQVIMWVSGKTVADPAKHSMVIQRLREMGVTAGMVTGDGDAAMWKEAGMPYYVENIVRTGLCLKQRSPVTDWSKFVNQWMETRDEAAFVRPYCLEDPAWLAESKKQMQRAAGIHKANAPLLYDIRDELSVTTSASPFDYDFSPQSLAGFRKWLQKEYGELATLNKQWDTDFPSWDDVRPFSTDQIKRRMLTGERMPKGPPDDWSALKRVKFDAEQAAKEPVKWNFAPWCDFRTYMDTVLARTLESLRQSARAVDSATPVGIEGTQMPHAFGGYDLWKLSQSLDWVEPYDVCNAREILGDFMPGKPLVCTVFEKDADHALRRLWHLLLLGDKGCIVWWSEDCIDASKPDMPLTEKGEALAPVFREMQSPLAKLFMLAEREYDPIAIHYSQASIQVAWLLESVADGRTWPRRFSSFESGHNRHAQVRNAWLKLLQDHGYTPRFVSTAQLEGRGLVKGDYKLLVMPEAWVVTDREVEALLEWTSRKPEQSAVAVNGGVGPFDGRGRFKSGQNPVLLGPGRYNGLPDGRPMDYCVTFAESDSSGNSPETDIAGYPKFRLEWKRGTDPSGAGDEPWRSDRLKRDLAETATWVAATVGRTLGSADRWVIPPPGHCIRTHRYSLGRDIRLLAFERGVDYHMSEDLKQAGGNEPLEKPVTFTAKLANPLHVYDLRSGAYVGRQTELVVDLDPWKPSLFALVPEKLPEGRGVVETLLHAAQESLK